MKLDEDERRGYRELADAVLAYVDFQIGEIFRAATATENSGRLLFVVTADHGEEFWEHGNYEHGHSVYDELLQVPLVVVGPEMIRAGTEISDSVAMHDAAATILEYAGIPVPPDWDSASLLPLLEGRAPSQGRPIFSSNVLYGVERYSAERDGYKYIYNSYARGRPGGRSPRPERNHELYRVEADPLEMRNLAPEEPLRSSALLEEVARHSVGLLSDHYVLCYAAVGGGKEAGKLTGTLALNEGDAWDRTPIDFVWPNADGSEGSFSHRWQGDRRVTFDLEAPRAILGFKIEVGEGPVSVDLALDGVRAGPGIVRLGKAGGSPEELPLTVTEGSDTTDASTVVERCFEGRPREGGGGAGPQISIMHFESSSRSSAGEQGGAFTDEMREQLRSLGYAE